MESTMAKAEKHERGSAKKVPLDAEFFRAHAADVRAIGASLKKVADEMEERKLSTIDVNAVAKLHNGKALIEHFVANAIRELQTRK